MEKQNILVVEDNAKAIKTIENSRVYPKTNIAVARNLQEGLDGLAKNPDYVITDLDFPPYEKGFSINYRNFLNRYNNFFNKIYDDKIPPKTLENLIKSSENDEVFVSKLAKETGIDFDEYFFRLIFTAAYPDFYNQARDALQKDGILTNDLYGSNGFKIVQECDKRKIPFSVYTGDWAHGSIGIYQLIESGLLDTDKIIAATISDYNNTNPTWEEDLYNAPKKKLFELGVIPIKFFREGTILKTDDNKYFIGNNDRVKDYSVVLDEIFH